MGKVKRFYGRLYFPKMETSPSTQGLPLRGGGRSPSPGSWVGLCSCLRQKQNHMKGSSGGSVVKNLPANAGHVGLTSGSGRSPGEGDGNSLQYSCLGNPTDRGAWQATVHGLAKIQT